MTDTPADTEVSSVVSRIKIKVHKNSAQVPVPVRTSYMYKPVLPHKPKMQSTIAKPTEKITFWRVSIDLFVKRTRLFLSDAVDIDIYAAFTGV